MYPKPSEFLEEGRVRSGVLGSDEPFGNNGIFIVRSPYLSTLKIIASDMVGWEHVSVSVNRQKRCPTWEEMQWVKEQFWQPHETVMQLHPPEDTYISLHPYTLHLWRPVNAEIPLPPYQMVGGKDVGENMQLLKNFNMVKSR